MARGSKTAADSPNDGMAWLPLMPFPAFNPLNWWALTSPRNMMLASLTNARIALDAWRASSDGFRAIVRLQQDEMVNMMEARVQTSLEPAENAGAPATSEQQAETPDPSLFVRPMFDPMIEATRAYGRVGKAFIVAQRDTMRAFSLSAEKPN